MNKKQRQEIFDKSNGHCWYCGCELKKGWHADHYYPIVRDLEMKRDSKGRAILTTGKGCSYPELDTIVNLVPSCPQCNNFKHSMSPEGYRRLIKEQFENTLKYSTGLRQLNRLGLVDLSPKPVIFWFEKHGYTMPTEWQMLGFTSEAGSITWYDEPTETCCKYAEIGRAIVTIRQFHNEDQWTAIATGPDYQKHTEKFDYDRHLHLRVAEWALSLSWGKD